MKKDNISLSEYARIDSMVSSSGAEFLLLALSIVLSFFLAIVSILIITNISFAGVCILLVPGASWFFYIKIRKKNILEKESENKSDWELAQKIDSLTGYLKANPPDFKKHGKSELLELKGLIPVRIDYASNSQIAGEISGTIKGFGLLSFHGTFNGEINAESTPELVEQHAVVLCVDKAGSSFRLIFPSSATLRKNTGKYILKLADIFGRYGTKYRTHSGEAVIKMWRGFLNNTLSHLNHQRIIDFLATRLSSGEKTEIMVYGIQIKEGTIIVSSIECEGKGIETVVPIDLMNKIRALFKERTNMELPPIPLLGDGR